MLSMKKGLPIDVFMSMRQPFVVVRLTVHVPLHPVVHPGAQDVVFSAFWDGQGRSVDEDQLLLLDLLYMMQVDREAGAQHLKAD